MINTFFLVGETVKITKNESKDPKKGPSAVLFIKYGPERTQSGKQVEFVNATTIRVPPYMYPKLEESLKVGQQLVITGHIQGVYKTIMDEGYFSTELVADRIVIEREPAGAATPDANTADASQKRSEAA